MAEVLELWLFAKIRPMMNISSAQKRNRRFSATVSFFSRRSGWRA
jgi:hypothetical protein